MLHRLAVLLIIGFWLAMTGLLVVREMFPEAMGFNRVPVSHVGGLCFKHLQHSELTIYEAGTEAGRFYFEPKVNKLDHTRSLELQGHFFFHLGGSRQRLSWSNCVLTLDGGGQVTRMTLNLDVSEVGREPIRRLHLEIDNVAQKATYSLRADNALIDETTISLDKEGMAKVFERLGLDPVLFKQVQLSQHEAPKTEFDAQESSTKLNGEKISTYLVSMKVGGQTMFEAHVSLLGQIVRAKIPLLNFKLALKDVAPE